MQTTSVFLLIVLQISRMTNFLVCVSTKHFLNYLWDIYSENCAVERAANCEKAGQFVYCKHRLTAVWGFENTSLCHTSDLFLASHIYMWTPSFCEQLYGVLLIFDLLGSGYFGSLRANGVVCFGENRKEALFEVACLHKVL